MNLVKDHDFRTAFGWSSLILVHLAFNIFSYIYSHSQIDLGFVFFEVTLFILSLIILTSAINISKAQGIETKLIYGFIYSLVTTYFVIYKFVFEGFYGTPDMLPDWGYLAIYLGWPMYIIVSIPVIIIFNRNFSKLQDTLSNLYFFIMILPTLFVFILLAYLSFTGRSIYKPLYEQKKLQIQNNLSIEPRQIEYQKPSINSQFNPARHVIKGIIKISNKVNLPIIIKIKPNDDKWFCEIEGNLYYYTLKKGTELKNYYCYLNINENYDIANLSKLSFTFLLTESGNPGGVKKEKTYTIGDFNNKIGF